MNLHNLIRYTTIAVLAGIVFFPFLGHVNLFDWDEINFAECAREMIVSKDYLRVQIDFQPFWEKPPLFIWMQVISMKLFGVNEYAARFPNALMGVITLITLFHVGKRLINERMAVWWTLLYAATWLPHFYFKSGIIDPTFNYFIFLSFYQVHLLRFSKNKFMHAFLTGLFLGLAVLTKGPVAALVAAMCFFVYLFINRGLWGYQLKHFFVVILVALLPFAMWFVSALIQYGWNYGSWFMNEFVSYQLRLFSTEDADHGGPFFYHFIVLLIGCFPASVFLFQYTSRRTTDNEQARDFTRWMWILFWITLILFSIVRTKIIHYSSLCYFPLTYLAALKVEQLAAREIKLKPFVRLLLAFIGLIWATVLIAIPVLGLNKHKFLSYINDPFAAANLDANVAWSWWEISLGIIFLAGILISLVMMRKNYSLGILTLCIIQVVIIEITIFHFTPKIEAYSQRSAISFFKSLKGKDVYVHPLGYKSFAHLFYTKKLPSTNKNYYNEKWLLRGEVDKPVYFICKNVAADQYWQMPGLQEIETKNGFVFFKRR